MKITFIPNPFQPDTTGALVSTAIVTDDAGVEEYFREEIRIEASEFSDEASFKAAVANKIAGFQDRVDAILKARQLAQIQVTL